MCVSVHERAHTFSDNRARASHTLMQKTHTHTRAAAGGKWVARGLSIIHASVRYAGTYLTTACVNGRDEDGWCECVCEKLPIQRNIFLIPCTCVCVCVTRVPWRNIFSYADVREYLCCFCPIRYPICVLSKCHWVYGVQLKQLMCR